MPSDPQTTIGGYRPQGDGGSPPASVPQQPSSVHSPARIKATVCGNCGAMTLHGKPDPQMLADLKEAIAHGGPLVAKDQGPPMTRVAFAGMAARIAQRAAQWAADCAQYPRPERQGEPMEREAALRFCASIEELLAFIKEDARG